MTGAWKGLRKTVPKIELVAFEPLQSPLLTTGKGGEHQVEGIGVGFEPTFLDQSAHVHSLPKFAVLMFISDKIEGI